VRRRTALLLGEIADPSAVEGLTRILADQAPSVRREAFEALEKIRNKVGEPAFGSLRARADPEIEPRKKGGEQNKAGSL
jgi:HEAT repeat protein